MAILIKDFIKHLQNTVYEGADVSSEDINYLFNKWSNEQKLKEYYKLQKELIQSGVLSSATNVIESVVPKKNTNMSNNMAYKSSHKRTFTESETSLFEELEFFPGSMQLKVTYRSSKHPYNFQINTKKIADCFWIDESDVPDYILTVFMTKTRNNPASYGKEFNAWKKKGFFTRVSDVPAS